MKRCFVDTSRHILCSSDVSIRLNCRSMMDGFIGRQLGMVIVRLTVKQHHRIHATTYNVQYIGSVFYVVFYATRSVNFFKFLWYSS